MLGDVSTIEAVERALELLAGAPVVLDPVMVAESGAALLEPAARRALVERLVPRAAVITPNVSEAHELLVAASEAPRDDPESDTQALARAVHALGPGAVVVTGGHAPTGADVFFDGERLVEIGGERHPDGAAHGSGCTHSSTLAARLALGDDPLEAARAAKAVASAAVRDGLREIGHGAGPVDVLGVGRSRSGAASGRAKPV